MIRLACELFGDQFSTTLMNLSNGVIALPKATTRDFTLFKENEAQESFIESSPCYRIIFIGEEEISKPFLIAKLITSQKPIDDLYHFLPMSEKFYAVLTLVKTRFEPFNMKDILSKAEKKKNTESYQPIFVNQYNIIFSPE